MFEKKVYPDEIANYLINNTEAATETAESDNSGHLCARTQNRLKTENMKPETVSTYKGKRSRRPSPTPRQYSGRHRNQYSQSGTETETSQTETGTETAGERHPDRAGDRDPATMYGSEPSQVSKPPAWP